MKHATQTDLGIVLKRTSVNFVGCPLSSVETRVKLILKECTRLTACFNSVKAMQKSCIIEDDEVRLSTALYNEKMVENTREDVARGF